MEPTEETNINMDESDENIETDKNIETGKKIMISGQNNRYQMKKVMRVQRIIKKRYDAEKWNLKPESLTYEHAIIMLNLIRDNNYNSCDYETIVVIQEIERKIYSYKQQDFKKNILDKSKIVELQNVVDKMLEVDLVCYYCKDKMSLLYEMARENKQWTIDRIDNDVGHNKDNYVLACLDCNLKRRRKSKEAFLFTKQMNIIKQDNEDKKDNENNEKIIIK